MATHKTFKTYAPTDASSFDINGQNFRLNPSVPGDVLLDFVAGLDSDNASKSAEVIRNLMKMAIVEEDYDRWVEFIRTPANNVTLNVLSEVAGFVSERMSGNPTQPQPTPFSPG